MERKTKIIATLGPAVDSPELISGLVGAGMDVARMNFSHGTSDRHRQQFDWVHRAAEEQGRAVALLQDIQGPKIRVGTFPDGKIQLESGSSVTLRSGSGLAAPGEIYIEHLDRVDVEKGDVIQLVDGMITLEVDGFETQARVVQGGILRDRQGAAFPAMAIDLPAITEKDAFDLEFGAEIGVDMVAASFVGSAEDIRQVKQLSGGAPVIAKLERTVGYQALDEIIAEADGVMVARGDLGVELPFDSLPRIQKDIIARTNAGGRVSITATEMLESMTSSPRPSRAEVTDVANAVFDGTDAVMLSAESAVGLYPIRAVEVMDRICREAEASPGLTRREGEDFLTEERRFPSAITQAAVSVAANLDLHTVVGFTQSGATARLLSKYRPAARIVAFTTEASTYRRMALYWGVSPRKLPRYESTDEMISAAAGLLIEEGLAARGDGVVMVAGIPPNVGASTNLLKIHEVGLEFSGIPQGGGQQNSGSG